MIFIPPLLERTTSTVSSICKVKNGPFVGDRLAFCCWWPWWGAFFAGSIRAVLEEIVSVLAVRWLLTGFFSGCTEAAENGHDVASGASRRLKRYGSGAIFERVWTLAGTIMINRKSTRRKNKKIFSFVFFKSAVPCILCYDKVYQYCCCIFPFIFIQQSNYTKYKYLCVILLL